MSIEDQIAAALDGRKAQQPFVNDLVSSWERLARLVDTLIAAAAALARDANATRAPDGEHANLFANLDRYLGDRADWRNRASALAARLAESGGQLRVLHRRVNRPTVNIGVIGVTGAGKSTLLRKLSGLSEDHIPSNKYASSTATPSKIFHESGAGRGRAVLHLHTWESFRQEVLVPLHEKAEISDPVPLTPEAFKQISYPSELVREGKAATEQFARRLRDAQESLPSYLPLLRGGDQEITDLDRLRPFVAYPQDRDSRQRPYHAVRSVDITCEFPQVGAVRLGLVDLPGSEEAGLDVHGRFLTDLRNETDLVFIVKRPTQEVGTKRDWDVAQLADDAAAGVRRSDFAHLVINRDASLGPEEFAAKSDLARQDAAQLGFSVRLCDIAGSSGEEVTQAVLAPTLDHLAKRLREMDRDAIACVLDDLAEIAAQARALATDLAQRIGGWHRNLPDEEARYRTRIFELMEQIGRALGEVTAEYDELYRSRETLTELADEIARAEQAVADWRAAGLGHNSTERWLDTFDAAIKAHRDGTELDRRYNATREKIVREFGEIDASLQQAIARLWGEVASALRAHLTTAIIPDGPDGAAALTALLEKADSTSGGPANTIKDAVKELLELKEDYGSLFLRVGRPLVREIWWRNLSPTASAPVDSPPPATRGSGSGEDGLSWMDDDSPAHFSAPPAAGQATRRPTATSPDETLAKQYREAWQEYTTICQVIESVSAKLRDGFIAEAQRMLVVLAASVEKFKDSLASGADVEIQWERICRPAQGVIWKDELSTAAAGVTTAMAALQQQATTTAAAADEVRSLVGQARRL